jgi:hypothetical protein
LLAETLHRLGQSSFPPEVMVEFSFSFTEGPERRTLRAARIQQVYVFFCICPAPNAKQRSFIALAEAAPSCER